MISAALYAGVVSLLLGLTAWFAERSLANRRWPRRGAWLAALLLSVAIPAWRLPSALPHASPVQLPKPFPSADIAPVRTASPEGRPLQTLSGRVRSSPSVRAPRRLWTTTTREHVRMAFLVGWGVITTMLLLRLLGAAAMLRRRARDWRMQELDGMQVWVTDDLGPAVYGIVQPRIVVPAWLLEASHDVRRAALLHEREHLRAHDSHWALLSRLPLLLMPWNLPLWWLARRLRFAVEVDCDSRVVQHGITSASYGEVLLTLAARTPPKMPAEVGLFERRSVLARRIRILTSPPRRWRRWAALPLYALTATAALAAITLPAPPISTALGARNASEQTKALLDAVAVGDARTIRRLLANGTPDALAAATLVGWALPKGLAHGGLSPPPGPTQRIAWLAHAVAAAPHRPDLLLLELNECAAWKLPCASAALVRQIEKLSPGNGAAALESLVSALRSKSSARIDAALAGIGKSQRVDTYYTRRLSQLAGALHQIGAESYQWAYQQVVDSDLNDSLQAVLALSTVCNPSSALSGRRISLCRAASAAMEHGDTLLVAQTGAWIALRLWPVGTLPYESAARLHRELDFMEIQSQQLLWPPGHHFHALLAMLDGEIWASVLRWSARYPSEQDVLRAQLRHAGLASDPSPGWQDPDRVPSEILNSSATHPGKAG